MNKLLKKILKQNSSPFIYAVTDEWLDNPQLIEKVKALNDIGVNIFQLRQKKLDNYAFVKLTNEIKSILNMNAILIINDNITVAQSIDAHGIHIGQDDLDLSICRQILGNDKIIGVSVQNLEQALFAKKNGADYIGVGSMFNTNSKDNATLVNMSTLIEIRRMIDIPIVIIGGININNIEQFRKIKIDGIAMIETFFKNENYIEDTLNILDKINRW